MKNKLTLITIAASSIVAFAAVLFIFYYSSGLENKQPIEKASIVDDLLETTPAILAADTPPQQKHRADTADTNVLPPVKRPQPPPKKVEKKVKEATVLICASRNSYAYHSRRCSGLNRCKAGVESITKTQAENQGRRPCKFCY